MAKDVDKAVMAAQLYLGSINLPIKTQQRLYSRMMKSIASIAKRRDMSEQDAYAQITSEARRRGRIIPVPGKDI